MDWKYIILAGAVGFLIGCLFSRIFYDIVYRKVLKTNIAALEATISVLKEIKSVYLDPVYDTIKKDLTNDNREKIHRR